MTRKEKTMYLIDNHLQAYLSERGKVHEELSISHPIWCVCGKFATTFHKVTCRKFAKEIDIETMKRLEHLIR